MSVFKRKSSPNYYYEFQVRGRRICRSAGTTSRREALKIEREVKKTEREIDDQPPALMTLDMMFARYWAEHAHKLKSADDIALNIKKLLALMDMNLPICELTNSHIADFVHLRSEEGVSNASVNRDVEILRAALNQARKKWDQPVKDLDWTRHRLKEPRERIRWLRPDQAHELLKTLPERTALIVEWSLMTGCRKSETLGLVWNNVNMARREARVWGKGEVWRTIHLNASAMSVLARCDPTGLLVFDKTNLRRAFSNGLRRADIEDFRFHDLRHTHATWLRQSGSDLQIVQRALGHSNIQTTARYSHVDDRELHAAVQNIPAITTITADVVELKVLN